MICSMAFPGTEGRPGVPWILLLAVLVDGHPSGISSHQGPLWAARMGEKQWRVTGQALP